MNLLDKWVYSARKTGFELAHRTSQPFLAEITTSSTTPTPPSHQRPAHDKILRPSSLT